MTGRRLLGVALAVAGAAGCMVTYGPVLLGRTADPGVMRNLAALAAYLLVLEGLLLARGDRFPALWGAIDSESATGVATTALVAGGLMGSLLLQFRLYAADDAYITFRFAQHVAQGLGPVWNPGEPPVEGYSNFLWMLIAAGALALGRDPLAVVRVVAVASIAASLVALWRLGREVSGSRARANLAVLLLAALPGLAYWTMSGLETASVVLLSLLCLLSFTRDRATDRLPWRTALAADLVLLSRPDGVLLVALAALPLLWVTPRPRIRWMLQAAALATPVAIGYFGWKAVTFHRLMPNTVAAKFHLLQGLSMSTGFLAFAFPFIALGLYRLGRNTPLWRHQVLVLAFGYMAALANAAAQVGHYHRFFLPVLAPMLALTTLLPTGPEHSRFRGVVIALAMVVMLSPLPEMSVYAHHETEGWTRAHVTVGRMLRRYFTPTDVLAASDCGAVPYYSGMRTVDMWGLADQRIAEHGFDAGYVMGTHPAVIILHSLERDRFSGRESYDRELEPVMERSGRYRLVGRWEFFGYWLWVYSDRALPVADPAATPR